MKRIYLIIAIITGLLSALNSYSQVIFQETFDNIAGPTAGGPGTYTFPTGWLLRNVDNGISNAQVAYVNDAWERREDFSGNVVDSVAFSTSYYSPAGTADDWMWTPPVTLPVTLSAHYVLSWNAKTYDPNYKDGYEVRVMTAPDEPTGGTGVMGNQITNSDLIFSTPAEGSGWTSHSVSLDSYTGQTIRIAFRNHSTDKFILVIDDVMVEINYDYDATLVSHSQPEFTLVPVNQNRKIGFSGVVKNRGANTLDDAKVGVSVYDSSDNMVFTAVSDVAPAIAPGASSDTLIVNDSFIPSYAAAYTVKIYSVLSNESDQYLFNDTQSYSFIISDSVFARDDGIRTGVLGIGAGEIGYLGQSFPISNRALLSSISIHLENNLSEGNTMHVGATVFKLENGVPQSVLYDAPQIALTGTDSNSSEWYNFSLPAPMILNEGDTIVVCAKEIDSTLSIGQTNSIFIPGTTFIDWPDNPFGTWAHNEDFGTIYSKPYMIRADIKCLPDSTAITIASSDTATSIYQLNNGKDYLGPDCNTLIAAIAGDNTLTSIAGSTHAKVWIESVQPADYVKRHYQITPDSNATTATGKITLYYTQQEFDDFNAVNTLQLPTAPDDATGKANLLIEKRGGTSSDGTGHPGTYSGSIENITPDAADIIWNAAASRWELSFNVTGFSGFFLKTQDAPLPLGLVKFAGSRNDGVNELEWITADERNTDHFELERSTDAGLYTVITKVPAKGVTANQYAYRDRFDFSGNTYYRLKMVDKNQNVSYSSIVVITQQGRGKSIMIYPNPARESLTVQLNDASLTGTPLKLVDMKGRTVYEEEISRLYFKVDISSLMPGIYYMRFANGLFRKIVKE